MAAECQVPFLKTKVAYVEYLLEHMSDLVHPCFIPFYFNFRSYHKTFLDEKIEEGFQKLLVFVGEKGLRRSLN